MNRWILFGCAALIVTFSSSVWAETCSPRVASLKGKWQEYRVDEFILQYTLEGEHALTHPADTASSGVPDVVADAATQLMAMREMLKHLGFQLPLQSQRYARQGASHILVRFRKLRGLNGRAFDEVRRLPSGECVLIIEVTKDYRSGNLTPAHELFHQVQNGYTPFKRPWFYEGMARWSESLLVAKSVEAKPIPQNDQELEYFWSLSYAAQGIWYGFIRHCDNNRSKLNIPPHLDALRYRNGKKVITATEIYGHKFVKRVLERLNELARRIEVMEKVTPHRWPEKMQRDRKYDRDIYEEIILACQDAIKAR